MADLNKDEYGQTIYVNLGQDVSTATALNFVLEPQIGDKLERSASDGVAVGTSNITVDDETYQANQYLEYTIKEGDMEYAGLWRIRGEATLSATKKVIGDYRIIRVLP